MSLRSLFVEVGAWLVVPLWLSQLPGLASAQAFDYPFEVLAADQAAGEQATSSPTGTAVVPHRLTDFEDEVFARSDGWVSFHRDARFQQRFKLVDEKIYCETIMIVSASVDAVSAAVSAEWDWWEHGRVVGWHLNADGTTEYDLWPTGKLLRVHEVMHPPVPAPGRGVRVAIDLSNHARGLAYVDVREREDGKTEIVGRFAGVEEHFWMMDQKQFTKNHLLAERGDLARPFPKGTGWVGLALRLEGAR